MDNSSHFNCFAQCDIAYRVKCTVSISVHNAQLDN